tara:strand:- start:3512 stop:4225 length:714 start_codon:yes stop_codon:yes gene_type:complete
MISNPSAPQRVHFLLAALLALFVLYPLLGEHQLGAVILDVFVAGSLLLTVRALKGSGKRVFGTAATFSGLAIAAAVGSHIGGVAALLPIGHVFGFLFFLLTGVTLMRRVLLPGPVTASRICAAVCAYLLIGLGWGLVYSLMEHVKPGAFLDSTGSAHAGHAVLAGYPHLTYYSFTTLTTLGFGDVVPATPLARSLSTLEAVGGQLYLALLVARLVGLQSARLAAAELSGPPSEAPNA